MATYTGTANLYNALKLGLGQGAINFGTAALKVALCQSGYTPSAADHDFADDLTNEVSGSGYARQAVTATWSATGTTVTLSLTDPVFSADGGSITARWWVLLIDAGGADSANRLLAYGLIDETPGDVTATDQNTLTIDFSASGLFSL